MIAYDCKVPSVWVINGGMRLEWVEVSYLAGVWIKNQSAVSTSLTLWRYTDLRYSFDLMVLWQVWKWNGVRVRGCPFDVVMQNFFYLLWSVWDRVDCPKTQLELPWMWADSQRGGVRCERHSGEKIIIMKLLGRMGPQTGQHKQNKQLFKMKSAPFSRRRKEINSNCTSSASGNKMTKERLNSCLWVALTVWYPAGVQISFMLIVSIGFIG